jgi:flagellar hook-associated protein 1 FlgK
LQRDLDSYLDHAVTEVNSIARKIADLNQQIVRGEISGHTANDLRDERMALIDQLAVKMNIQWTEDPKGNITVVAGNGGKAIVHENYPRPSDADPLVFDYPQGALGVGDKVIRWQDTNVIMSYNEITGGEMGAWLQVRDYDIPQTLEILGEYTHTLIGAVNILHSNGAGLEKFETVTGSYITQTPNSRFGAQEQDLPFADIIHNGEISLWVYQNGMQHQYTISVSVNDSMQDVVQRINQTLHSGYPVLDTRQKPAAYLKENEYGEGYQFFMSSAPNSGVEFAFESDSSGLLAAMGVNTFFSGDHMSNIGLNDNITNDVKFIAAGRILPNGEHALGDNTTALRIAAIKDADIMSGGTQTLNESIIQWSAQLGTKIANTRDKYSFAEITHNELMTQRDNVSAVNSDEELINLIMFQRAYQAAAKLVTTADTLLQTILDLKR